MSLGNMTIGQIEPERVVAPMPEVLEEDYTFDEPPHPSLLRRIVVKVRLLPMVIFFSTLTLTVRVGDIWNGVDGALNGTVSVSGSAEALAQGAGTPPAGGTGLALGAATQNPAATDLMTGTSSPTAMPKQDRAAIAARMLADDPTLLTQSEIDLLQKLAERRVEIDARAQELDSRQVLLAAAETRIDRKIEEFKALQSTIETLVNEYDKQQTAKLASLVKIYENMKPKDAARIFEKLEMNTLLLVAERMKERSLAPIMAKMAPQRARDITVELNQLRKLPDPVKAGG